jgi:hypothetical protein
MRAKSRWAVIVLGLSTGFIASPLCAQQKPSILESIGGMFGKDSPPPGATPPRPARAFGFAKPGSIAQPPSNPTKPAGSSGTLAGKLFGNFNGLDTVLGTTPQPVGESDQGIEAPPPPTLEAGEPEAAGLSSVVRTSPISKPAAPPTKTPSLDLGARTSSKPDVAKTSSPVMQKATALPLAAAPVSATSARTSSRRGWQSGQQPDYSQLDDTMPSPPVHSDAPTKPTNLIDRRLDSEGASTGMPGDRTLVRIVPDAGLGNDPPEALVQGRVQPKVQIKPEKPQLEGRDRVSQAARLGGATTRVKALDTEVEASETPNVQAASYDLPPILTPEEARALRASRGK